MRKRLQFLALLAMVLAPSAASAQTALASEDLRAAVLGAETPVPQGWKAGLSLGSTFSFNQSQSVVGTPDGVALQLGILAEGQAAYVVGQHTWTNTLKLVYAESKTPVLDRFVKSADGLDLTTTYAYRLQAIKWVGPYARARLSTQLAPSYLVKPTAYGVKWQGDAAPTMYAPQQFVQLTGALDPILVGGAVGLFANPTESEAVTVKLKVGLGSQQLLSSWGYTITKDSDPTAIEVKSLQSATQAGGELGAQAYGQLGTGLQWKARATFFMPVFTSITGTPTGFDALNSDFAASASYKLAKWLSLDYVFSAKRIPLVSDKWQVQNGAVLTAGFNL